MYPSLTLPPPTCLSWPSLLLSWFLKSCYTHQSSPVTHVQKRILSSFPLHLGRFRTRYADRHLFVVFSSLSSLGKGMQTVSFALYSCGGNVRLYAEMHRLFTFGSPRGIISGNQSPQASLEGPIGPLFPNPTFCLDTWCPLLDFVPQVKRLVCTLRCTADPDRSKSTSRTSRSQVL